MAIFSSALTKLYGVFGRADADHYLLRTTSKTGLAILAGGLAFVGASSAADLIVNFPPDHVVVIMDENRTYGEIIGNTMLMQPFRNDDRSGAN